MSNHPNHDQAMKLARTVGANIRTLRANSQNMLRSLVVAIAVENFDQKSTLDAAKAAMQYPKLEKKEQGLVRQQLMNVRVVVENWSLFTDQQRAAITDGKLPENATDAKAFADFTAPATPQVNQLAAHCKARDKAADSVGEGETETPATETPATSDETASADDTAHIMATISTLESETPSDDQIAALALLFDAVDAYRERIIAFANAA